MEKSAVNIFIVQLLAILVDEVVQGQHTIANVTMTEIFFTSPGYIDGLNYGNNMTRDYSFHSNYPGHTLQLKVIDFELEEGDKNGVCHFDKVIIYDGYNVSAEILTELCGTITPGTVYDTSNNTVYVVFSSDDSNTFRGFNISIVSNGPIPSTSTQLTTVTSTIMTTTMSSSSTLTSTKTSSLSPTTDNFTTGTVSIPSSSASTPVYPKTSLSSSESSGSTSISLDLTSLISKTGPAFTTSTTPNASTESSTSTQLPTPSSNVTSTLSTLLSTTTIKTSYTSPPTGNTPTVSTEDTTITLKISPITSAATVFNSTSSLPNMSTASMTTSASNQVNTTTRARDDNTGDNGYIVWVIVACCLLGFLLLVISVVVITRCLKRTNRADTKAAIHPIQSAHTSDNVVKSSYQSKAKPDQDIAASVSAGNDPGALKYESA